MNPVPNSSKSPCDPNPTGHRVLLQAASLDLSRLIVGHVCVLLVPKCTLLPQHAQELCCLQYEEVGAGGRLRK